MVTRGNVLDTSVLAPARGFIIQGGAAFDQLGWSVSGAGDINGDGLADLIVGAFRGDDGGMDAGEAYIIYGRTGDGSQFGTRVGSRQVLDTTSLVSADGFILQGDAEGDQLGWSVSGAGDINGDGLADLIVGARRGDDGGTDAGEAYIVYGKAGDGSQFGTMVGNRQVLDTTNLASSDGFILQGDEGATRSFRGNSLGVSVSGAGDINGDGLDDLIVGAWKGDDGGMDAGEAYIIYGKAGPGDGSQFGTMVDNRQVLDTTNLAPADGFILQGDKAEDFLGMSVSGAGDINGDGLADLIVGAYWGDDGGNTAGEAYVVYGKAGTGTGSQFGTSETTGAMRQVLDTTNLAPADGFILQGDMGPGAGEVLGDELGVSVSGAGDINGDGLDDLIVGARKGNDGGMDAGEAYIIYGKAGSGDGSQFGTRVGNRQVLDTSRLAPTDGFILQGDVMNDMLGVSVSGAGDVNGDGLADLIAGASMGEAAYIIYGKAGTDGMQFGEAVEVGFVTEDGMTIMLERQVLDTSRLASTDGFALQGDMPGDLLGISASGAGDINGDGFDDLIVGAWRGDDGGTNAGEAYVVYGGAHLGEVVTLDQTLTGGADDLFLLGGAGDDRLVGHADTEVLYGGAGDDTLELVDASFRRVDGGSGVDTLVLGSGVVLDLTDAAVRGRIRGVEAVSLSDATAAVTLDLAAVYVLVESRDNGGTLTDAGEVLLRLKGVSGAMVDLEGPWTLEQADAEGTANLYAQGSARLLIDDGLYTAHEPVLSRTLSNRIAPVSGHSIVLDLADYFTDRNEDGRLNPSSNLTFEVSSSIGDTAAKNIVTAMLTGSELTLTPGAGATTSLWEQETVTVTASDHEGGRGTASFAVVTRGNVLDASTLAPAQGFIIQGDGAHDALGTSVSGAGDVNGDGIDDLIAGGRGGDGGGNVAGEAYIVYGKAGTDGTRFGMAVRLAADGTTTITDGSAPADSVVRQVLDTTHLAPADGFIIQGDVSADFLGASVSGTGDVNGDGLADLIVGAYWGDDGGRDAGEAYIVYGKAGIGSQFGTMVGNRQVLDTTNLAPADGFIIQGDMADDYLGSSVSGAGDINGDGLYDLIVGARFGDDGGPKAGEAYIIYGKTGDDGTQFGMAVRLAADGRTTITDGSVPADSVVRQVLDTTNLAPADGFILQGDMAADYLGWSVSGAGDVNGDGLADLIVGAQYGDDGGDRAGEAYIIYGKTGNGSQFGTSVGSRQVLDTTNLAPADGFILQGDTRENQLGYSVSGAGDVNGDGFDDLIVGANVGGGGGEAYIIYGKAGNGSQFGTSVGSRRVLDTTNLAPADGFIIQGDVSGDQLGTSVSGAGDINGDGLADLIAGARFGSDGGMDAGEAYIIYGKAGTGSQFGTSVRSRQVLDTTNLAPTDGFILQGDMGPGIGEVLGDELGTSVSGAGDINGDGFDDLIAGAKEGDDGGRDAGEAYVIYGGTHLGEVVTLDQTLAGAASESSLLGGAGNDTLTAHTDTEVLYGGAGDDELVLADASFRRVDGGSGVDTLVLGSGVTLDLTGVVGRSKVRGVEVVSLSDATAEVELNLATVYALVEARDNGGTLTDAVEALLRLEGVSGAMVVLEDTWTLEQANAEGTADLYAQGSARLLIDDGLVA